MSLQFKPLSLVALATTAVLYGCGGDDAKLLKMRLVERRLSAFSKTTSKSHELEVCLPPGEYDLANGRTSVVCRGNIATGSA